MDLAAVRPRTWLLGALAGAVAAVLVVVGIWQWSVAFPTTPATLPTQSAVPVAELVPAGQPLPSNAIGRAVLANGRYDAERALTVTGHELDGRGGTWQLVPLITTDGDVLPVVRAFVAAGDEPPPIPGGAVRLEGRVQPSYLPPSGQTLSPDDGAVAAVDTADLVNRWGGPIHPAYVVAESELPAPPEAVERVPATPIAASEGLRLRNLAYALQWFFFAAFALLLWGRLVRDDVRSPP